VPELIFALRLVHVVAGVGWAGEVLTLNFVLLPALFKARANDRAMLLQTVFPYVFRLATVLGGIAIISGLGLLAWYTQLDLTRLVTSTWGWRVLVGGSLGGGLYAFHVLQESGMEHSLAAHLVFLTDTDDPRVAEPLLRHLALFPRIGIVVLLLVIGLMSAAARLP
jgi:uncharacterized membrane protein